MASNYHDRFLTYNSDQISFDTDHYNISENGNGNTDYTFGNNDFNVKQFLSNLVVRWEYSPGSTVFLVFSQTRSYNTSTGQMDFFNNVGDLFNKSKNIPHNVFLIKFSYRFGLK
jgi:carbohydrate-binding DOMON domain-containing protein